ncbi:pentapeptide repeat-containing protein [Streptomyces sp. NPDC001984]
MTPPPPPNPSPPSWPHCGHGGDPTTDPVGCRGIHVPGHTACLAHLAEADRDAYLASLTPGANIDHRGTPITELLLSSLLNALRDPATEKPHLGSAMFDGAHFSGEARFDGAHFSGEARFDGAQFTSYAGFGGTQFTGDAGFGGTQFSDAAGFERAEFSGVAGFDQAQFSGTAGFRGARFSGGAGFRWAQFSGDAWFHWAQFGDAWFDRAQFSGDAWFHWARFSGTAGFNQARFSGTAGFNQARFVVAPLFGPVVCSNKIELSGAVFEAPVTLEVAAPDVRCVRTRWDSTATVRLRYATADLSYAVLAYPIAVNAHPTPFTNLAGNAVDESLLSGRSEGVRLASIQGADAAHLVLTDTDLTDCLFSGAFHLDQLRLDGRCTFAPTPAGWHRRGLRLTRWTRRRTLAEEHHWRAQTAGQPPVPRGSTPPPGQWRPGPHHPDPGLTPDPDDVATLYRQLRKAFEDGKNEPGAADFYYGEMEMRRHDHEGTAPGERGLLWGYWLLSGYGLRASRALGWLAAAMLVTIVLLMGFGLPKNSPKQEATGTVPSDGGKVTFEIDKEDPQNPTGNRFTAERFDKALNVTLNSVVFRSSGQDLTTAGTYIEMTSRLLEPTLLALAALAVRGRIKR